MENSNQNFTTENISAINSGDSSSIFDIKEIYYILLRRKFIVLSTIFIIVFLTLVFLFFQTTLYQASAVIQVNSKSDNVIDVESVISSGGGDDAAIQSEIDIIQSRHIAYEVIKKLDLQNDEEFNPAAKSTFKTWLSGFIPSLEPTEEEIDAQNNIIKTNTINTLLDKLSVYRKAKSYTIYIEFTSSDAKKSAEIANAVADEYLLSQLKNKFDATQRANEWLTEKLSSLQKKLQESEMAVQLFTEQNNLIETGGLTINDQQLSELNSQLILARTSYAQAKARLQSAKGSIDSASEVLNSNLIQTLRGQEAEVLRKKSDLSNRYGARHPKMINVNAELRDLRKKIETEIQKIKVGLKKEVEIAKTREDSLEESLKALQGKSGTSTMAKVQLAELQRQRDANRSLYESFLNRSKELFHNQDLAQADAKIISKAETPLRPSYPRKSLILLIALMFGGCLGTAIAIIIEKFDDAFKNSDQLEKLTSLPCIGIVPELDSRTNFISYVTTKLSSVYVESLRSVLTAVHFSNPDNIPKVLLVTSSVPDEGKTTFSASIAAMNAKSGKKVLLIDGDLKKPSIAKILGADKAEHCIANYLTGEATEKQIIRIDKKSGLHFISSSSDTANSQELLNSKKMKEFIEKMKEKYDLIVIDSPPIMAVSDAMFISKIVDSVIYVVRWDKTPRQVVKAAIKQLLLSNAKIAGTVLTNVNMDKLSSYDYGQRGYYYKNYSDYYTSS